MKLYSELDCLSDANENIKNSQIYFTVQIENLKSQVDQVLYIFK